MTPEARLRILVVDDDRAMLRSLVDLLEAADWHVEPLSRADRVLSTLERFEADVVLSDVRMPGMSGLELLKAVRAVSDIPLVLISAHGDIPMAVSAMQDGAYSFIEKPYEPRRLLSVVRNAGELNRIQRSNARLRKRLLELSGLDRILIGNTPAILKLRQSILSLADSAASILLLGETGTGKDVVARSLHDIGPFAERPFVAVNCALLTPERFTAEMFGVAGGPPGKVQQADGGTLFLDEICACPPDIQARFLRVLEDSAVTPDGGDRSHPVNLRIICATNEDIETAVARQRFREDLYFRINTVSLMLPPLRERREDLQPLLLHFLEELAPAYEVATPSITSDDLAALLAHDWPGNVRELRSVAQRRLIAARLGNGAIAEAINPKTIQGALPTTLREAVAALERDMISRAIQSHAGRMDDVAEALGIGRRTLNEKIVKLGLEKERLI
jgi:DNA-binding NtrC family response regulator